MANHSLILDKRKMIITCQIVKKYKDIFLLNDGEIKLKKESFLKGRYSLINDKIYERVNEEFKKNGEEEKFKLRIDENYKVNLKNYLKEEIEAMEESKFIGFSETRKYLDFLYSYPDILWGKNDDYKNELKKEYLIEQRINDLIIYYNNNFKYDGENEEYSKYSEDFIYEFEKQFNIHEIRAGYKMDGDYVFYGGMKDALANYDENIHYDISGNEYKRMCKNVYKTKYGEEDEENKYFFFRNC